MPAKNTSRGVSWPGLALSALSGVLLTLSMPGFDVPLPGWIALTPLLAVLFVAPPSQLFLLTLPFGIIFSIDQYGPGTPMFVLLGIADLQRMEMGIAMCHFELTARELGLEGKWEVLAPAVAQPGNTCEYVVTWIGERRTSEAM